MESLFGSTADEIFGFIEPHGFKYDHALSIANGIYKKGITDAEGIKKIPGTLKKLLREKFRTGILHPVASEQSSDQTVKYLFRADDGRVFETVCIPEKKRNTVCISSQAGCRMGCSFCHTGRSGFYGNLSAGEMVSQVLGIPGSMNVTHVVFMGMGEPMDNIGNVLKACEILTSEWGCAISVRNVTVSTVGVMPGIAEFLDKSGCNLVLSLFSPFPEERANYVPAEKIYPAAEIVGRLKAFPLKKKRRLSIAYVMIRDLNDTGRHLEKIKSLISGSGLRVNLLPYNQTGDDEIISSSDERIMYFKHSLVVSGISASVRKSRGADISAACGMLAHKLI